MVDVRRLDTLESEMLTYNPVVYIPTRGRVDRQTSMRMFDLRRLHLSNVVRCIFVVPRCEHAQFRKTHFWLDASSVVEVPDSFRYGDILQAIADRREGRYKVVMDDDLHLIRRRNPTDISQKGGVAAAEDIRALFKRIGLRLAQGYVHGGISLRQTNHFCVGESYKTNTKVSGMWFYDSEVVRDEGIRFDAVQERSDFHGTLSLLELGYENICEYEFAIGQYLTGTNAPGGCSRYRTPEFLRSQAELLASLHPRAVRMVMKSRKSSDMKGMADSEGNIPDVRIQWSRSVGIRSEERRSRLITSRTKLRSKS